MVQERHIPGSRRNPAVIKSSCHIDIDIGANPEKNKKISIIKAIVILSST